MNFSHERSVSQSLREYGRGIAGGLMFSLPLLYTMEVWWSGFILHPGRILFYVAATFGLLLVYNRYAGLREDATFREVFIDSVEETGIGLVLAAAVLWLTGRLHGGMDTSEIVGKVVMEAMTVAIGVSVGTAQLGVSNEQDDDDEGVSAEPRGAPDGYLSQSAIALCGGVLFAANVAPTDEVMVLAMENSPGRILGIAAGSILLGMLILHFADFRGSDRHVARDTAWLRLRGITTTYAVALLASAMSLYFFGRLDGQPAATMLAQIVVLGFPATLGASAGRLLLQTTTKGA